MSEAGPNPVPAFVRLVRAICLRPTATIAILALLGVLAAWLASRLELRSDFSELLPTSDPAVHALEHTRGRVGDMNLLLVGIRSPDRAANLRYAAELTESLQRLPKSVCALAAYHIRDVFAFFESNRWLYASEDELASARDRLRTEILKRKNPLAVSLDEDDAADAQVALPPGLRSLQERFPDGYFVRGDYAWVATLPPGGVFGSGEQLLAEVRRFVAAHPPAGYQPAMIVMPTGPVMSGIQNREAIERDVLLVTVLCTVVIGVSIVLFFHAKLSALLVALPAVLGTLFTFGATRIAIGYLNTSTAFLGSIILGNGINHSIVLLARFREIRAQSPTLAPEAALQQAAAALWRPTLGAALAAAGAYASLMLTSFRGFSQFGFMGSFGALSCWAFTFLLLPALVVLLERRRNTSPQAWRKPFGLGPLGRIVQERPRTIVVACLILTVVCTTGVRHFLHQPFEYDFRKLSTELDQEPTYVEFDRNLDDLFGRWHSPQVLLADRIDQVEAMKAAIRAKDRKERPTIGQIVTVFDVLPGNPTSQRRKLALLTDIRGLIDDPALELADESLRARLRKERPPASLRVLVPEDLPPLARRPFTEADGTVGRVVLAYHSQAVSMWNGKDLLEIASVLQRLELPDGSIVESSGVPMVFGAMLRAILHDGPRATLLALLAVMIVVPLMLRPIRAGLLAVATLLVGVLWMVGAAGLFGVKITFLNFVALPITFGVGVEYAVNIVSRLRAGSPVQTAIAATGGAVALCSWTTIVGYGSLLAARSQALRGFGAMAILGELATLVAAIIALPAFLGSEVT